jgi:hypothetical protein
VIVGDFHRTVEKMSTFDAIDAEEPKERSR